MALNLGTNFRLNLFPLAARLVGGQQSGTVSWVLIDSLGFHYPRSPLIKMDFCHPRKKAFTDKGKKMWTLVAEQHKVLASETLAEAAGWLCKIETLAFVCMKA